MLHFPSRVSPPAAGAAGVVGGKTSPFDRVAAVVANHEGLELLQSTLVVLEAAEFERFEHRVLAPIGVGGQRDAKPAAGCDAGQW
jgi:hypothetical protein